MPVYDGQYDAQFRPPLTFEERETVRAMIDNARRSLLYAEIQREIASGLRCAGCGCHYSERTRGCHACTDRIVKRNRRDRDRSDTGSKAFSGVLRRRDLKRRVDTLAAARVASQTLTRSESGIDA